MPLAVWEDRQGLQQEGTGNEDEDEEAAGLCGDAGACVALMGSSHRLVVQPLVSVFMPMAWDWP